jgi:DNA repair protein SbcD/Mre11
LILFETVLRKVTRVKLFQTISNSKHFKQKNMRILHTADWHLGKYLEHFPRLEEQREVLEEICMITEREKADIVIVAGDLFDTFNPPNEASELLYRTLHRLSDNGRRAVIAIAGNHDSPERIDMPDALARECGIVFAGLPMAKNVPFATRAGVKVLQSEHGFIELQLPDYQYPIRFLLTPYANELRLRKYLGSENREEGLRQMLGLHWTDLAERFCDDKGVNLLVTHLYMMQENGEAPEEPEGEKNIMVGGAQAIYTANVPSQIQYTALGHLHRYQNVGSEQQPVVYSGSPLAYSFAEANQTKYVTLLNIEPAKPVQIEKIALTSGKPLLRNRFEDIEAAVQWLAENQNALVQLTIVAEKHIAAADNRRLREAHNGIVHIFPEIKKTKNGSVEAKSINIVEQSMEELFEDFFKNRKGTPPNQEVLDLFKEVLHHEIY